MNSNNYSIVYSTMLIKWFMDNDWILSNIKVGEDIVFLGDGSQKKVYEVVYPCLPDLYGELQITYPHYLYLGYDNSSRVEKIFESFEEAKEESNNLNEILLK